MLTGDRRLVVVFDGRKLIYYFVEILASKRSGGSGRGRRRSMNLIKSLITLNSFRPWYRLPANNFSGSGFPKPQAPPQTFPFPTLSNFSVVLDDPSVPPPYPASVVIFLWSLTCLFSIETIGGNLLVLIAYRLERSIRMQLSSHFIVSLAVSDLIIGAEGFPMLTLYVVNGERWPLGYIMCQVWLCIDYTLCLVSILTVLLITVDRYGSVCYPAKYRQWQTERKVQVMVVLSWLFPSVLFILMIFGWENFTGETIEQTGKCYAPFLNDPYVNMSMYIVYYWTILIAISVLYRGIHLAAKNLEERNVARHQRTMALMLGQRCMAQVSLGLYFHAETQDEYVEGQTQNISNTTFNAGRTERVTEVTYSGSMNKEMKQKSKAGPDSPVALPVPTILINNQELPSDDDDGDSSDDELSKNHDVTTDLTDTNLATGGKTLAGSRPVSPVTSRRSSTKDQSSHGRSRSSTTSDGISSLRQESPTSTQSEELRNFLPEEEKRRSKTETPTTGSETKTASDVNKNSRPTSAAEAKNNADESLYPSEEEDEEEDDDRKPVKAKKCYYLYGAINISRALSRPSFRNFFFRSRSVLRGDSKATTDRLNTDDAVGRRSSEGNERQHLRPPSEDATKPLIDKCHQGATQTKPDEEQTIKEDPNIKMGNNWLRTLLLNPASLLQRRRKVTRAEKRARRAFRTITVIVGTFALFWSPYYIVATVYGFCPKCVPSPLFLTSYYLCYLNSSFNPFAYAFANRSFRRTFIRILSGDLRRT